MTDTALRGESQQPDGPAVLEDVPGWFWDHDRHSFEWFLGRQAKDGVTGDLMELGAYLGRSAIVIGEYLNPGETFTVCDLFDSDAPDDENSSEMNISYRKTLTRSAFETNYLAFHDELPEIIQAPTSVLAGGRVPAGAYRFIHIDASHLYEHVADDLRVARTALQEQGVVVLDDYRAQHTPGVAAATWEAVFNHGLKPIMLTECKFYGTWGDPEPFQRDLLDRVDLASGCYLSTETLNGRQLLRMTGDSTGIGPFRGSRHVQRLGGGHPESRGSLRTAQDEAALDLAVRRARAAEARRPVNVAKRAARDLLPPVVTSAIRRARRG
ncbi:class I SAM-dependent methyltransferase [Kitasatospora sp. NPDC096077]|uniref:class I SAM-dependent methyltransferase n=1 Tax=Kitasatospora sp. NPDC096077 TaxID=3155544 RepID=UPI003322EFAE